MVFRHDISIGGKRNERLGLEQTLEHCLDDIRPVAQVVTIDHETGVDEWNLGVLELDENRQPLLFHPAAEEGIEQSGIDVTRLDGLRKNRLIADGVDANMIAVGIQAQMFEGEYRRHPGGAADVGDAEAFAA